LLPSEPPVFSVRAVGNVADLGAAIITGALAMQATVHQFRGVPSFFRACCRDAAQQNHRLDYSNAGYHLARHLLRLAPLETEFDKWANEVDALWRLCELSDVDTVIRWFVDRYPRCMALVPKRRRRKFAQGVFENWLIDECGSEREHAAEQAARICS
jgi:hypothetical protein